MKSLIVGGGWHMVLHRLLVIVRFSLGINFLKCNYHEFSMGNFFSNLLAVL